MSKCVYPKSRSSASSRARSSVIEHYFFTDRGAFSRHCHPEARRRRRTRQLRTANVAYGSFAVFAAQDDSNTTTTASERAQDDRFATTRSRMRFATTDFGARAIFVEEPSRAITI